MQDIVNLRAQHRAALMQVKTALLPGDPRRFALLKRLDEIAAALRAAETKAQSK